MELIRYEDYNQTQTVGYGTSATSASANKGPLFLKKELNSLYNYIQLKFTEPVLIWDSRETYNIGDAVLAPNGNTYVCTFENANTRPPDATKWDLVDTNSPENNLDSKYVRLIDDKHVHLDASGRMGRYNDFTSVLTTPKFGLYPYDNGGSSVLGASNSKFREIHVVDVKASTGTITTVNSTTINASTVNATTFNGALSGTAANAQKLNNAVENVNAVANTIVKRDSSGQIKGTASSAKYADLAERYESDTEYEAGTVLGIGGDKEVTLFQTGLKLAGVVSTKPGFKMNDRFTEKENSLHPYIALKGRIPVKVAQRVKKGDYVIASFDKPGFGIGISDIDFESNKILIGIALSDSVDGIVEVKI